MPVDKARNGHIAVSADGENWIWTSDRSYAYLTRDKGASWVQCQGLPQNMRVIADKVNPKRFYGVDAVNEIVYSSEDGGLTFRADTLALTVRQPSRRPKAVARNSRGDSRGGQDRIYSMPGREKDLWIAAYDGLYHSTSLEGYDFKALDKVRTICIRLWKGSAWEKLSYIIYHRCGKRQIRILPFRRHCQILGTDQ